jgi:hypothetical protein
MPVSQIFSLSFVYSIFDEHYLFVLVFRLDKGANFRVSEQGPRRGPCVRGAIERRIVPLALVNLHAGMHDLWEQQSKGVKLSDAP